MSTRTRLMLLTMAAMAAVTSMSACDPVDDPLEQSIILDSDHLEFRCQIIGGCGDGRKANDMFAGQDEYSIAYLPLEAGAHPSIDLEKVETNRCYDRLGNEIWGDFVAYAPDLSISNGEIQSFQVRDATDPAFACSAYGPALLHSEWFFTGDLVNGLGMVDTVDVKLMIMSSLDDGEGRTLYEWHSDHQYLYGGGPATLVATCDQTPGYPGMDFYAMLYDELEVNPEDITFGSTPNVAYIGCLSGTVGKTGVLWDYDQTDMTTAQVAANAAMAAYCGDGVSYTQTGTMIDLWNIHGAAVDPDQVEPDTSAGGGFELEAVWNADNEALCIGTTRMQQHQPAWGEVGAGFPCDDGGQTTLLPECTPQHLDDPAAVLASYTYVGP